MSPRVLLARGLVAITILLLADTASAERPADDPRALFAAGLNYMMEKPEPKYEEALELFRVCYARSHNFRALLPMGICELHLEMGRRRDRAFPAVSI